MIPRLPGGVRALARTTAPALLLCTSCATPAEHRDWSAYAGPGREHLLAEQIEFPHVEDDIEPANRVLAGVNYGLLRYVLAPVGRLYRFVVPGRVRDGLENATENIAYPRRLVTNAVQGKWSEAWDETRRFAVNTTVGVAGVFDPATSWLEIPASDEDFGQALARAGWEDSTYLFVPLIGPSTIRDALGAVGDAALNPLTYVTLARPAARFNAQSDEFDPLLRTIHSRYDVYQLGRFLYVYGERVRSTDHHWRSESSGEVETLAVVFLEPQTEWFPARRRDHSVRVDPALEPLTYSSWIQEESAPIVFLVPGLGSHRLSPSTVAMAEVAYQAGASVVTVSSTMNFEFIANGASVSQPGYLPVDAADLQRALLAISDDLEARYPGHAEGHERILVGASMGGAQVLWLAGRYPEDDPMDLDVLVAIDPPVDLQYASEQIDAYYNIALDLPPEEREEWTQATLDKALEITEGSLLPTQALPFTEREAKFLIGVSFRLALQDMLLATQERHDLGVLRTERSALRMTQAYEEASRYSFMAYVYGFLLPYYAQSSRAFELDEVHAQKLFEDSNLRSVEEGLRRNERVRVIVNSNDFLLGPEGREWVGDVFGERAHTISRGGHLGNLHREDVQELIRSVVERAGEEAEASR